MRQPRDDKPAGSVLAPRIREVARQAAEMFPSAGEQGVVALARLAEVSSGQVSRWINGLQRVPMRRALLVEINSQHRIRAEDLLPEDEAFLLLMVRLAALPSIEWLDAWEQASGTPKDKALWHNLRPRLSNRQHKAN